MRFLFFFSFFFLFLSCTDSSTKNHKQNFLVESNTTTLPYIGNMDIVNKEENGQVITDTIYDRIPLFHYINQDSLPVSNDSYSGKIWITEFFFTSCPTICPIMNVEMLGLYEYVNKLVLSDKIQFLSFSIDPDQDTPGVLRSYKNSYCDSCLNWDFLTGDEIETHRLGIENFKIFAGRDEDAQGGYAHSGAFSLVDTLGHVRGVYNITDYDGSVNKLERQRLKKRDCNTFERVKVKYVTNRGN